MFAHSIFLSVGKHVYKQHLQVSSQAANSKEEALSLLKLKKTFEVTECFGAGHRCRVGVAPAFAFRKPGGEGTTKSGQGVQGITRGRSFSI